MGFDLNRSYSSSHKETMPVIKCCDKEFIIPYNRDIRSEYIKDVVKISGSEDVTIPIPDKYCSVIDTYINFIDGEVLPLVNNDKLLLTFQLCKLLVDDSYFNYWTKQVLTTGRMCVVWCITILMKISSGISFYSHHMILSQSTC